MVSASSPAAAAQSLLVGNGTAWAPLAAGSDGQHMVVQENITIDKVGCYVQSPGGAGAVVRIAVYQPNANPYDLTLSSVYATLRVDAGTVAATGVGPLRSRWAPRSSSRQVLLFVLRWLFKRLGLSVSTMRVCRVTGRLRGVQVTFFLARMGQPRRPA